MNKSEYYNQILQQPQSPNTTCLNPTKLDENYAPVAPKLLFVRAMEYLEKVQIDTRKLERSPQYFRPLWTSIDHNRFDHEPQSGEATKYTKLKLFTSSTKNMIITANYTPTDRKKTKRLDTQ
jgi:hypothetical protein